MTAAAPVRPESSRSRDPDEPQIEQHPSPPLPPAPRPAISQMGASAQFGLARAGGPVLTPGTDAAAWADGWGGLDGLVAWLAGVSLVPLLAGWAALVCWIVVG